MRKKNAPSDAAIKFDIAMSSLDAIASEVAIREGLNPKTEVAFLGLFRTPFNDFVAEFSLLDRDATTGEVLGRRRFYSESEKSYEEAVEWLDEKVRPNSDAHFYISATDDAK